MINILWLIPVFTIGFSLGAVWISRENRRATKEILDGLNKTLK